MQIHRYTIFINGKKANKSTQDKVDFIIESLIKCRVPRCSIKICNVSDNKEFEEMLESTVNGKPYPLLYLWGEFFGTYEDVQTGILDGSLALSVLNDPSRIHQGKKIGLIRPKSELENAKIYEDYIHHETKQDIFKDGDIINEYQNDSDEEKMVELKGFNKQVQINNESWISGTEWLLRVLSGMLFVPLIQRVFETKEIKKLEGDIEFNVIRTNWYWKHQKRIIRFSKDKFYRFNGDTFREEFNYDDISDVFVNGKNIVINFNKNSYSQFIECDKCDEFLSVLEDHCHCLTIKKV
ncbi:hypothetical protein ENUP19_0317G0062 [Entamoeba nuttalli]|uniref:Uncharacterized protein n=2 Tax=Entamoeba nuttalli TaxID=412467 RepID=K2GU80_ENTNP|nr:hypothetical protein ENU1_162100 [Entamoeba nuttalli P19]EKE38588.1 hypothetical protein ENU1_162100 [Entamoeba nuttalli P19]|eukprot:XP_008859080.1 hypothetical protein ENU1_162100 [Entamoeba nuttalli P19]